MNVDEIALTIPPHVIVREKFTKSNTFMFAINETNNERSKREGRDHFKIDTRDAIDVMYGVMLSIGKM